MHKLVLAAILLALLGAVIWWSSDAAAPAEPPQPDAPPAAPAAPAPLVSPVTAAPKEEPIPAPVEAAAPPERTAVATGDVPLPEHTLRGRAVDAAGQPLAGIQAGLIGWTGNSQRLAAWTKDNAEPARIDQKATTGPDGVFTFRCWPPPPFQFALRLQGGGVATWGQRWNEWTPGGTTDLGDVKLERGTLLRGRVVDSAGAPVAKVEVRVEGKDRARGGGFESWSTARTDDAGAFVQRWPLVAGEYTIRIDDQVIERGAEVTLTGEPEQVLDVVCKRIDPAESIRGVVVDETGAPIRGATVHPVMSGSGRMISTDAQGRFRVLKRDGAPAEVALAVSARGFEAPAAPATVAWGTHDVRIVLTRGKDLVVLAVRATDGTPVENYVLRVIPTGRGSWNSMDREPRGKPPHKQGRATVRGIAVGKHRVIVEPKGAELAIGIVAIEVGPNGVLPVTVRLVAATPRVVRVVTTGGAPVAGAKVQLVDTYDEPWDEKVPVFALASSSFTSGPQALELAAAVTDANGDCTLPVPGDRALALMLPGPGHTPLAVQPAVFPGDGPLVVTVSAGAVLRGTLGPEAAFAELKRLAGVDGASERMGTTLPWIQLHRGEGPAHESFPKGRTTQPIQPDGSFELTGVPPGRWNATVNYWVFHGGGGGTSRHERLGSVDLVDGQVTTIMPDLSGLLPGTLEALVLHDGAPLANTLVRFDRLVPGEQWPQLEDSLKTDAEGRVRCSARAGEYRASWGVRSGESWSTLRAVETAVVRTGETTRQTFTIVAGTLKVRLVDSTGAPVANVHIFLADAAGNETEGVGVTGADGRIEKKHSPGTFTVSVMPKRLQDQKAQMEFYRTASDPGAIQRVRVTLGSITVRNGETIEVELKLPAEW